MNIVKLALNAVYRAQKTDKPILYFDMDNVLIDFQSGIDALSVSERQRYAGKLDEVPGIFAHMRPMNGAVAAFHLLNKHFDCYILSTAPWDNPGAWQDKRNTVEMFFGEAARKKLILSHNKNLNFGHYLIDDRTANGAGEFMGEHIHFGTDRFPDWPSVVSYLLKEIK
ncbi:5' nucleotidase [Vibrio phage 1.081.O._10N.286.52.C2]|nr:5' nucleotidase [Vibrio phage 1.081.O._10N.286.52.C2]